MKKLLALLVVLSVSACADQPVKNPQVYSVKGVVVNEPKCLDTVCRAVIKVDEDVWKYDPIKAPVRQGDTVYKACRYYPDHELCSAFWTREKDVFYPTSTAKGVTLP